MEETQKGKIARKILVVAMYVCSVLIAFFVSFTMPFAWYFRVLVMLSGLVLNWLAISLFHELGHVVAAKLNGFDTVKFDFLIFGYDKMAVKRFSVKFGRGTLGETDVAPTGVENIGKRYARVVFGGIAGSIFACVVLTVGFVIGVLCKSPVIATLFCGMPLSYVVLIINSVSGFAKNSDGEILSVLLADDRAEENPENAEESGGENEDNDAKKEIIARKEAIIKLLTVTALLKDGKTYGEISPELYETDEGISESQQTAFALIKLRRAEELADDECIAYNLDMLERSDCLDDESRAEMLCAYIILDVDDKVKEYENALEYCDDLSGAASMRTLIYHAEYRGDKQYVKTSLKTAKKICTTAYLKGDGKFNEIMLSRIADRITE